MEKYIEDKCKLCSKCFKRCKQCKFTWMKGLDDPYEQVRKDDREVLRTNKAYL